MRGRAVGAPRLLPAPGLRQAHTGVISTSAWGRAHGSGFRSQDARQALKRAPSTKSQPSYIGFAVGFFLVPRNRAGREGRPLGLGTKALGFCSSRPKGCHPATWEPPAASIPKETSVQALGRAALVPTAPCRPWARRPWCQGAPRGEAGAARPRSRHGPRARGCARCHQRQPHLRAKLRNASS